MGLHLKFSRFLLLTFLTSFIFSSCEPLFAQKYFTKQQIEKEINITHDWLKKYHMGLYYYESENDFLNRKLNIINKIKDSVETREAYALLAELVSGLKDLHTGVYLPKKTLKENKLLVPLVLRKYNGKHYIHFNESTDSTINRGIEILSINNKKISDYESEFKSLYGADNDNAFSKNYYSTRSFSRFYNFLNKKADSLLITLKSKNDSVFYKKIAFEKPETINKMLGKRYKNNIRKNFDYKILDSLNKIAKLDITSFSLKKNKFDLMQIGYKSKLNNRFKKIENSNIEHLILDLRGNGGGSIINIRRLVKKLSQEPFKMLDSSLAKKATIKKLMPPFMVIPYVPFRLGYKELDSTTLVKTYHNSKLIKPSKNHNYKGKLYVLMDGGSYSATVFTIGLLKDLNRATFIGTPPGGANWGSFAGRWLVKTTPYSKTRIRIPSFKFVHAQPNKVNSTFLVEPDYFVEINFTDFLNNKDTIINFTTQMIKSRL
jgi:hypothetical protein